MYDGSFEKKKTRIIAALIAVYLSWGSTYLAIKFAIEGLPPLFMMGTRFLLVGIGMYVFLRLRGAPGPNLREWWWSTIIGVFLMLGGSASVAYAEQWVSSGLAALAIATTPIWSVLFAGIWKHRPTRIEWAGLIVGLAGVVLLNFEGDFRASPLGAAALMLAPMSWAFGSVWSQQVPLPKGMMAGAAQMITGGGVVMAVGLAMGERVTAFPGWRTIGAVAYLGVIGSLVGFSAYVYLLGRVRPALATSYAYVNPVIAVALGIWLAGEEIALMGMAAMLIIITGVALVILGQRGLKGEPVTK